MDWDIKFKYKADFWKKYKRIYSVPTVKSLEYVFNFAIKDRKIRKILEVGAGSSSRRKDFIIKNPNIIYKTMDIDKSTQQDYYNLNDIEEKFDIIIGLEVIEHIKPECFESFCNNLYSLTDDKGSLILTTPNIFHPTRFLTDYTHYIPLCYDELASVLMTIGYNSIIPFRFYSDSTIRRIARQYLFSWLYRLLEIDYAKSIVIIANKGF